MKPVQHCTLEGKVLVIIGGTSGIGLSAAKACLAAGAKLAVVGLEPETQLLPELGSDAQVLVADATEPGVAEEAISAAVRRFGGFHGLYHVAGGSGRGRGDGALDTLSDEGWEFTLRLNLTSTMRSCRAAVRELLRRGTAGSVLTLSSVLATHPFPKFFGTVAYATAKAAIEGLTLASASTYASSDIRFNCIAPGLVATPMSRRAQENSSIMEYARRRQPLLGGGIGQPHDLDAAAVFLLSDSARWITGQVLTVDGGWGVTGVME